MLDECSPPIPGMKKGQGVGAPCPQVAPGRPCSAVYSESVPGFLRSGRRLLLRQRDEESIKEEVGNELPAPSFILPGADCTPPAAPPQSAALPLNAAAHVEIIVSAPAAVAAGFARVGAPGQLHPAPPPPAQASALPVPSGRGA